MYITVYVCIYVYACFDCGLVKENQVLEGKGFVCVFLQFGWMD